MDLSLVDKMMMLVQTIFSSFLTIELFLLFLTIYLFLLMNRKVKNKVVSFGISGLLLFIVCLCVFFYQNDIYKVLSIILKEIMRCFYFPNIIFYLCSVVISLICLCLTIFGKPLKNKIIDYTILIMHLLLFTIFISVAYTNQVSLMDTASIYQHNELFVLMQASQILFILYFLYRLFLIVFRAKLKKLNDSAIMNEK